MYSPIFTPMWLNCFSKTPRFAPWIPELCISAGKWKSAIATSTHSITRNQKPQFWSARRKTRSRICVLLLCLLLQARWLWHVCFLDYSPQMGSSTDERTQLRKLSFSCHSVFLVAPRSKSCTGRWSGGFYTLTHGVLINLTDFVKVDGTSYVICMLLYQPAQTPPSDFQRELTNFWLWFSHVFPISCRDRCSSRVCACADGKS